MRFRSYCSLVNAWKTSICTLGVLTVFWILEWGDLTVIHETNVRQMNGMTANLSQLNFKDFLWSSRHVGFPQMGGSDCFAGFSGVAKNSHFIPFVHRLTVSKIIEDAQDCDHFRESYGMERYPPPLQEENEFPLAFSIVFHKDFDQVLYLLRAIYRPQNVYCLHVDKKSPPEMYTAVKAVVACLPNLILASKMEDVVYAGFSRLQADLTCMNDSLQHPVKWRYFINLVGQQFPLKSNLEMVRILKLFNGSNDIEGITAERRRLVERYLHKYVEIPDPRTGLLRLHASGEKNPPPPHNFEVVKGSAFGTFSRAFVQFLMEDSRAADLIGWSHDICSPDEYVWATLHHSKIMEIPGGYTGKPDAKPWFSTYANWGENRCGGRYVRGICIFSPEDLPLLSSRHEFTANKVYITENPGTLHCLDQLIFNLTVSNTVRDLMFYRHLPFVS